MNFRKYGFNETNAQSYDIKKITATKCGKTYNVYDAIQAANVDTDIKEVMKKYHCNNDTAAEIMLQRGGLNGVYADIFELQEKAQDLPSLMQLKDHIQKEFDNLPLELRQKFGNSPEEFLENGIAELKKTQKSQENNLEKGENKNANK